MNRTELVQAVSERAGVSKADADRVLASMAEIVGETIAKDEKVSIPGFVTFERAFRAARTARNPQTGEEIKVAAKHTAKVSAGATLKNAAAGK
jgi:DNA-binding protein HU-beta